MSVVGMTYIFVIRQFTIRIGNPEMQDIFFFQKRKSEKGNKKCVCWKAIAPNMHSLVCVILETSLFATNHICFNCISVCILSLLSPGHAIMNVGS